MKDLLLKLLKRNAKDRIHFGEWLFYTELQLLKILITLSFRTDGSGQTVQTQIRLLLEEQSDQGLHCLLFHLHHLEVLHHGKTF